MVLETLQYTMFLLSLSLSTSAAPLEIIYRAPGTEVLRNPLET